MCHPSHVTRTSFDASSYDEICINCYRTDIAGGGWGDLAKPCPNATEEYLEEIEDAQEQVDNSIITNAYNAYYKATGLLPSWNGIKAVLEELGEI